MNNDIGYLIKQLDESLHKHANRDLEPFGLTMSQFRVLLHLREREKARLMTSHKDIEAALGVSHPTVVGLLRRLEAKGFVRTETGAVDRRVRNVFLVKVKPSLWSGMHASRLNAEKKLLAGFSKEEASILVAMLKRVLGNIQ
jgi:DNA-binding MarR family transcriptional regulator